MSTIKQIVKQKLENKPKTRNSDKMLMFSIWFDQGIVHKYNEDWKISFTDFMKEATSPESIRRARQEIQSENPELQPTDPKVIKARKFKKDNYEETVINAMF